MRSRPRASRNPPPGGRQGRTPPYSPAAWPKTWGGCGGEHTPHPAVGLGQARSPGQGLGAGGSARAARPDLWAARGTWAAGHPGPEGLA